MRMGCQLPFMVNQSTLLERRYCKHSTTLTIRVAEELAWGHAIAIPEGAAKVRFA
jgi:hypothetical protein